MDQFYKNKIVELRVLSRLIETIVEKEHGNTLDNLIFFRDGLNQLVKECDVEINKRSNK